MVLRRARPLQPAVFQSRITDAVTGFPDLFWRMKIEEFSFAHRASELTDDFPISLCLTRRLDDFAHTLDASLGIHKRAFPFERRSDGEKDIAPFVRDSVEEHVLDDDELE